MLRDLLLMKELFDYLIKVQYDIVEVKIADCNIEDRYGNYLEIKVEFTNCDVEINKDCVIVYDKGKQKEIYYNSIMDLINILEKIRKY